MCSHILTVLFIFVLTVSALPQGRRPLFRLKEPPAARSDKSSIASVRESEIAVSPEAADSATVTLPLFDGRSYEAHVEKREARGRDEVFWAGKIRTEAFEGDVILNYKRGFLTGLIYAPGAVYEIVPRGQRHYLVEIDQRRFPECAGAVRIEAAGDDSTGTATISTPPAADAAAVTVPDSGDRIDVVILYTAPVKADLGGDAQAQAFAQQAVDAANVAFSNSKIRLRVRLAGAFQTDMAETGVLSTELANLASNPPAATLREQYKADLVSLFSNSSDGCGMGYLMGAGNPTAAFSVVSRSCAVGNLSFAHEIGHNLGSQHNPESGGTGTYPYSHGHWVNSLFRTVMSYADPCTGYCARRPYYSNPSIFLEGVPTGIEDARDNARSINNTADTVANYRYSGSSIQLTNFNGGETIPRTVARTVTWTSENAGGYVRIEVSRDESSTWQTLIPFTPNDGSEPVATWGAATRRARIRVVSVDSPWVTDSSVGNLTLR